MKKHKSILLFLFTFQTTFAQYPNGDKWYNNPLAFKPLELHTAMGFLVPAVAVGTCLLLTKNNPDLKNRISIYNETGLSWGYKYPETFMLNNNTGINYHLRRWMSVGVEFGVYQPSDNFNKTTGFAIRPFARFYSINNEKWRLYFESGGGFIYFLEQFPMPTDQDNRQGLNFNGVTKYGIGTEMDISKPLSLSFGIKHLHISNGNAKGIERNPSHDSNGLYIGISYKLNK